MSPRLEREAAMDDMATHAEQQRPANLIDTLVRLPTEQLVAEGNALSARMLGAIHTARDFAVVAALVQRVQQAGVEHAQATNREPLEGMLMLDFGQPLETDESFALSISELMERTAPAAIADFFKQEVA